VSTRGVPTTGSQTGSLTEIKSRKTQRGVPFRECNTRGPHHGAFCTGALEGPKRVIAKRGGLKRDNMKITPGGSTSGHIQEGPSRASPSSGFLEVLPTRGALLEAPHGENPKGTTTRDTFGKTAYGKHLGNPLGDTTWGNPVRGTPSETKLWGNSLAVRCVGTSTTDNPLGTTTGNLPEHPSVHNKRGTTHWPPRGTPLVGSPLGDPPREKTPWGIPL
jgi:hypothetical protein